ncbi:MAG TPA: SWIM zinc finger family protein [Blastocatellia bacterium]|nr:SWIM zinc finger family protein [Blastocatellia bacterium]
MITFKLTEAVIRSGTSEQNFSRGQKLYRNNAISETTIQDETLTGHCRGTQSPFYLVRAELDDGGVRTAACGCDYTFRGYCKHIIALLLTFVYEPERFAVRKGPEELIAGLDRGQLIQILAAVMRKNPQLYNQIEALLIDSSNPPPVVADQPKLQSARAKETEMEPYRRRIQASMRGRNLRAGDLAGELEKIEKAAMEFLAGDDAETAYRILTTLLNEGPDGFGHVDDSYGELGDYLTGLGETLAEVILSLDPGETRREEILEELGEIDGSLQNYGIDGMEIAMAAATWGWREMPHYPSDLAAAKKANGKTNNDKTPGSSTWTVDDTWKPAPTSQIVTRLKLNVLEQKGRIDEYLALCLRSGAHLRYALKLVSLDRVPESFEHALKHLATAMEALDLAQALRQSGHLDLALKIGEFGLKLDGSKATLGEWLGPIAETMERVTQALEAWQAAFRDSPSLIIWRTIKRLAGRHWVELKPDLMASMKNYYDLQPKTEILLEEQEWDAAVKIAEKDQGRYSRVLAMVADGVIEHRPEWVMRMSTKQAEELIEQAKSKYYPTAAEWLRRAKAASAQCGQSDEWQKYLSSLKQEYKRRPALMAELERL